MYSVYTYRRTEYAFILGGIIFFMVAYILFWSISEMQDTYQWVWKLLLAIAMITSIYGYEQIEKEAESKTY